MKKECAYTKKQLRRYLVGYLFKPEEARVERHLKQCALCRSEFQTLKLSADTQKILKDITPPEGMVQRVKEGVFGLGRLRKLLYRPFWILGGAAVVVALYYYVFIPYRHVLEGDGFEGDPSPAVTAPAKQALGPQGPNPSAPASTPAAPPSDALEVTITVDDEKAAVRRINDVMQGHALLRTMRLSDAQRELSGSLTAKELLTFFHRIEAVGKLRYSSSRLESYPAAQPIPFVLRLKAAPRLPGEPGEKPVQKPVEKPVQTPVQTPGYNPGEKPGEKPAPPAPATP